MDSQSFERTSQGNPCPVFNVAGAGTGPIKNKSILS
jgi:hypothetical protein